MLFCSLSSSRLVEGRDANALSKMVEQILYNLQLLRAEIVYNNNVHITDSRARY